MKNIISGIEKVFSFFTNQAIMFMGSGRGPGGLGVGGKDAPQNVECNVLLNDLYCLDGARVMRRKLCKSDAQK